MVQNSTRHFVICCEFGQTDLSAHKHCRTSLGERLSLFVSCQSIEPQSLVQLGLRFLAEKSTAPVLSDLLSSLVVVGSDGLYKLAKIMFVLVPDVVEGNRGAHLSADELSEAGSALDNAVWHVHLSAEGGEVDYDFDGVDVVSDHDELSLLSLDQLDDLVDSAGEAGGSLSGSVGLAGGSCLCSGNLSSLLLGLVLGRVLLGELKELSSGLLVQSLAELVDARGHLESLLENSALSLEFDVLGPSDESREVALGLDVLSNTKVLGSLLKERVLLSLLFEASALHWGRSHSLTFSYHFVCSV